MSLVKYEVTKELQPHEIPLDKPNIFEIIGDYELQILQKLKLCTRVGENIINFEKNLRNSVDSQIK